MYILKLFLLYNGERLLSVGTSVQMILLNGPGPLKPKVAGPSDMMFLLFYLLSHHSSVHLWTMSPVDEDVSVSIEINFQQKYIK